jgi:hypothetical protein
MPQGPDVALQILQDAVALYSRNRNKLRVGVV